MLQIIAGLDPTAGGPPASAVATGLALRSHGVANEFAFAVEPGREDATSGFVETLSDGGIRVHRFREPRVFGSFGRRWGISPRLAFWLVRRAPRFDVIHVHSSWTFTTVVGLFAAKLFGRVSVLSSHESLTDYDQLKSGPLHARAKRLLRWFYLRAFDVVLVASALEQSDIGDPMGGRSVVVPHAVVGISATPRVRVDQGDFRVGYLGRLHPKKNVEILVEALTLLPQHVTLHVAGDGPLAYRESLATLAAAFGVADRITWLGFVDRGAKDEFLASIDVLAMPSAFECFGVAAAEALIAGLPVVVSSRVGIADVIVEYGCGRVVPPRAPEIARALSEVLLELSGRHDVAATAQLAAEREFSIAAHGKRINDAYERALAARGRRRHR